MRRTCATRLLDVCEGYKINACVGHTDVVADKHYRQVTKEHIARVTERSTSTAIVQVKNTVYRHNSQEYEPDYSEYLEDTNFWEMAVTPGRRPTQAETIYLYEALRELGPELTKFFTEDYCPFNLERLIDFYAENRLPLPKISTNFFTNMTDFSSAEFIVFYEALQHLGADFAKFCFDEYGGVLTLGNLCHCCATYGITISCVIAKEIPNCLEVSENDLEISDIPAENLPEANIKKAPIMGHLEETNGRTWSRTKDLVVISDAL